jgi:hypothetical protein
VSNITEVSKPTQWKPGQSGNLNGRPEVKLTIEQTLPGNLSAQDWAIMREIIGAVRQAVPDAAHRPAGQVLKYVSLTDRKIVLRTVLFGAER